MKKVLFIVMFSAAALVPFACKTAQPPTSPLGMALSMLSSGLKPESLTPEFLKKGLKGFPNVLGKSGTISDYSKAIGDLVKGINPSAFKDSWAGGMLDKFNSGLASASSLSQLGSLAGMLGSNIKEDSFKDDFNMGKFNELLGQIK